MDQFGNISKQELHEVYFQILYYFIPEWFLINYKSEIEAFYGLILKYYEDDIIEFPVGKLSIDELIDYKSKIKLEEF
ncbi:MAG: hypothetical protein ACOCRO_06265 [Halanaerobiales bacterium]